MTDVLVIGGGPAGVTAALRARELGAEVTLVEAGRLGGVCTNDGCVPTRVLARAARLARESEQLGQYGLIGTPPSVDFAQVLARTRHTIETVHAKKQLPAHLHEAGITLYDNTGGARFVDPHTVELPDGTRLKGDSIILCVGGHARRFDFPGCEHALTHSDVWTLDHLPKSVAIVGGAATGCQLASVFNAFGARVHVLEVAPRLLGVEDALVSETIHQSFLRRGIHVTTGIGGVERIDPVEGGLEFAYKVEGEVERVQVEAVILAVGWAGNADSLNLAAAGLEASARGYVPVDDTLVTDVPHIYAAGDANGRMMLVQSGSYEGRLAAENAMLSGLQPYRHAIVPHGGFTDPEYGGVGLTEEQARAEHGEVVVATVHYAELDRAVIDGLTEGFCKLIVSPETHRIVGAHAVGEQALEVIEIAAAGMAAGMWVEDLAEVELAYPTYSAIVGLAARRIVRELGVMPLAQEWRSLDAPPAEWEHTRR